MDAKTKKAIIDLLKEWTLAHPSAAEKANYGRGGDGGWPSANELIKDMEQDNALGQGYLEFMEGCAKASAMPTVTLVQRVLACHP